MKNVLEEITNLLICRLKFLLENKLTGKIIERIISLNIAQSEIWINEAKFGYSHIKDYCERLETNANILEIGCGSGILLSILSDTYKDLNFEGIEPFADGHSSLKQLNRIVKDSGVSIENIGYEDFFPTKKYSLIFCINVFEHLKDWRDFLNKAKGLLEKDGRLIILCPNYGFPYESHFRIPILINKSITLNLFKKYIQRYEVEHNCEGLWNSLNFVKKRDVIDKCNGELKANGKLFKLIDDLSILDFMIQRIVYDSEFRKRQKIIGSLALIMKKLGVIKFLKLFPNFLPYMKLDLQ